MTKTLAMPACSVVDLPEDSYCLELIFNPCAQEICDACPIRDLGRRPMKINKALAHVSNAISRANAAGFKKLRVHLIGGDALADWAHFTDFCAGVWSKRYPVQIAATTCGFYLDENKMAFLLENSWRLRLIFRWNGEAGRKAWEKFPALKYHPMTQEIDYCLSRSTLKNFAVDAQEVIDRNKRLVLEFLDLDRWNKSDFATYVEQMKIAAAQGRKNKLAACEAPGDCAKRLSTVDIHGENYPCRYFSPERLTYSALRDIKAEYDAESTCPVATYLLRTGTYKYLNSVRF